MTGYIFDSVIVNTCILNYVSADVGSQIMFYFCDKVPSYTTEIYGCAYYY